MILPTSISARASCESQPSLRVSHRRLRAFFSFVVASSRASRRRSHPPLSADTNTKRETGRTAQLNNIAAAKVRVERERLPRARRSVNLRRRAASIQAIFFSTSFDRLRFCRLREISISSPTAPHPASSLAFTGCRGRHPHDARAQVHAQDDPRRVRRCVESPRDAIASLAARADPRRCSSATTRSIARHPTSIVDRRRSVPPRSFPRHQASC